MDILTHRTSAKPVIWVVALAVLVTSSLIALPVGAQTTQDIAAVVVLPVIDQTGSRDALLAERATDALALALEDSGVYRVIPKSDLTRELRRLVLTPPLSELQQVRVGQALQAQRVVTATLKTLAVNPQTGEVRVEMDIRALVVDIGTIMNGAAVEVVTKPIPGFTGDTVPVVNEALREVSERAVAEMERNRRRHGAVILVDDLGNVTVDLGLDEGLVIGDRLVVMRGFYLAEQDKTVMRNIGTLQVKSTETSNSLARSVSGQVPRIGDRIYPVYTPPEAARQIKQGKNMTQTLQVIAGLGIILGMVATATGPQNISPPGLQAVLHQSSPGASPVVRVYVHRGANPQPERTHAWLFFRGPSAGFPAEVDDRNYLVSVMRGGSIEYFEDDASTTFDLEFELEFTFFDREGEEEDANVDINYNHFGIVPGNTYFYKAQRVVTPWRPQLPTTEQATDPVSPTIEVDPPDALGEPSKASGPVTVSQPAVLTSPVGIGTPVSPTGATFTWIPQTGADEYQVQVYSDPLLANLVTSSPIITWTGQSTLSWTFHDFTFSGDTTYYWVVGSRRAGEAPPECQVGGKKVPFILSSKESFRTVLLPPAPVTSSAAARRPRNVPGWWREHRTRP